MTGTGGAAGALVNLLRFFPNFFVFFRLEAAAPPPLMPPSMPLLMHEKE
jgi:hypothetical protein